MDIEKHAMHVSITAHGKQPRRGTQEPYVKHPIRVAEAIKRLGVPVDVVAAAYLHDTIEDTPLTYADLQAEGFSKITISLVELLTKRPDDTNATYIQRLIDSKNRWAILIKIYDINDNLIIHPDYLWDGWDTASIRYVHNRVRLIQAYQALTGERHA